MSGEPTLLVTGGAGYIGSHYVLQERLRGRKVVVLDNLVYGHREAVLDATLVEGDIGDRAVLDAIFSAHQIDAVVHFAAFAYVGESVVQPGKYFRNNAVATLNLLEAMRDHKVNKLIFSSSCATYGNPVYTPIDEAHPQRPINPYGESKRMGESMAAAFSQAYGLQFIALRYFNASGADPERRIGESHTPETHLIPLILQAALGRRPSVSIFGTDYDTPDGTCIRDYIHVADLAKAHGLALDWLRAGGASGFYNLGTEHGFSVREVIRACERVTGRTIPVIEAARREGDPPRLVASAAKARAELGWSPTFTDLDAIISTAWVWEQERRW